MRWLPLIRTRCVRFAPDVVSADGVELPVLHAGEGTCRVH